MLSDNYRKDGLILIIALTKKAVRTSETSAHFNGATSQKTPNFKFYVS
jgi:hypothetical protein